MPEQRQQPAPREAPEEDRTQQGIDLAEGQKPRDQQAEARQQAHRREGLQREGQAHPAEGQPVERQVHHEEDRPEAPARRVGDQHRQPGGLPGHQPEMGQQHHRHGSHEAAVEQALRILDGRVAGGRGGIGHDQPMPQRGGTVQRTALGDQMEKARCPNPGQRARPSWVASRMSGCDRIAGQPMMAFSVADGRITLASFVGSAL